MGGNQFSFADRADDTAFGYECERPWRLDPDTTLAEAPLLVARTRAYVEALNVRKRWCDLGLKTQLHLEVGLMPHPYVVLYHYDTKNRRAYHYTWGEWQRLPPGNAVGSQVASKIKARSVRVLTGERPSGAGAAAVAMQAHGLTVLRLARRRDGRPNRITKSLLALEKRRQREREEMEQW